MTKTFKEKCEGLVNELKTTTDLVKIKAIAKVALEAYSIAEALDEKDATLDIVDEAISAYAKQSKADCYKKAKESGDPMKYAVTTFFYPTIRVKDVKDPETKIITSTIEDAQKPIDLADLHKKLGGIGADPKWIYALEKYNYYLTIRAADRLKATIDKDCYYMNEIAKEFEMGKTPTSNTQLLKNLQNIVDMMLGKGYHALSLDVNYLVDVYATDDKKSKTGVNVASHKALRNYIKKVLYRILTKGEAYSIYSKEFKNK